MDWRKFLANIVVICLEIMPGVSKSQLGKHGAYLKKTVCIDKTVESNLAFYTTVEILFRNPTSVVIIFKKYINNPAFYDTKCY